MSILGHGYGGDENSLLGLELCAFISLFPALSSSFILFLTGCLMVTRTVQDCNGLRLDGGGKDHGNGSLLLNSLKK